jgi:hypothetical protein
MHQKSMSSVTRCDEKSHSWAELGRPAWLCCDIDYKLTCFGPIPSGACSDDEGEKDSYHEMMNGREARLQQDPGEVYILNDGAPTSPLVLLFFLAKLCEPFLPCFSASDLRSEIGPASESRLHATVRSKW